MNNKVKISDLAGEHVLNGVEFLVGRYRGEESLKLHIYSDTEVVLICLDGDTYVIVGNRNNNTEFARNYTPGQKGIWITDDLRIKDVNKFRPIDVYVLHLTNKMNWKDALIFFNKETLKQILRIDVDLEGIIVKYNPENK